MARSDSVPDLLDNDRRVTDAYHECAARHNELVEGLMPPPQEPPKWWQVWRIYW